MNNTKLLAVAAGFLAATGIATAGKIFIDGVDKGEYQDVQINGNGTVKITTSTSTSDPLQCGVNEVEQNGSCVCKDGYERDFKDECVPIDDSGGDTGGDTGGSVPADCSGVPQAGTRDTSWTSTSFPPGHMEKKDFTITTDQFVAVQFTAPSDSMAGYYSTTQNSDSINEQLTIAVSECPGDFNQTLANGVCKKQSGSHSFWLSTWGLYSEDACELEPGKTYFMNMKYAKPGSLDVTTCPAASCGALITWKRFN